MKPSFAFAPYTIKNRQHSLRQQIGVAVSSEKNGDTDSYETSDSSSKGIVSSLTGIVNFFMRQDQNQSQDGGDKGNTNDVELEAEPAPRTPQELMKFVEEDYTVNNYLWTGDIHLPAFEEDCVFSDPTLKFTGTQKFVSNVKNLVPIVDFLTEKDKLGSGSGPRSDLLDITINEKEQYVQSRWNMVGDLSVLPWKPAIDVIGRTKFWYRESSQKDGFQIYFYDEEWELPASTALLQLVTPKGSIPNSNVK